MTAAEIAVALDGKKASKYEWRARCPVHRGEHRNLSIKDVEGGVSVWCYSHLCDRADIWAAIHDIIGGTDVSTSARPSQPEPDDELLKRIGRARRLWNEGRSIRGTTAERYLGSRGLELPDDLSMLRFHPRCPRGSDERHPALVCALTSVEEIDWVGDIAVPRFKAVHRIFLLPDGSDRLRKDADGEDRGKMSFGPAHHTVVRLSADEDVTMGLGICEGVEDAVAALNDGWAPMWSTAGTGGLQSFPVLGGIEALTVFADDDTPGISAATVAVDRWRKTGRQAEIVPPPWGSKDLNQFIQQRRGRHG
ncbi:MAG: DUF7146 domain-containing protein [Solimonas sp.]